MTPKEQEMNWLLAMECGSMEAVDKLKAYIKQLERDLKVDQW